MKSGHIKYLKELIRSIKTDPIPPDTNPRQLFSNERIFEVHPTVDKFQELIPFCVIEHTANQPERNGRRTERLEPTMIDGVKNLQFLKEHYNQEYKYVLNFWLDDVSQDILSKGDFTGSPLDSGIVDQALIYIAKHERYATFQGATVRSDRERLRSLPIQRRNRVSIKSTWRSFSKTEFLKWNKFLRWLRELLK
ncbi:hypothetical protein LEP1GSC106_3476 [Leptospira interrogans serovar Grippotyphosa str. UI 12764]|nr:hypothetical protein LEP1GSC106_3476 [Leptospira interrogans serovar Grippotyphosa str. UI 12764]